MLLKYCKHVLRPNSSKKALLLLRQTFIEIPKFMSSNNSTNSQTTSYNVPQEMPPTKEEIAEIAKKIPIDKRSLVLGLVVDEFEKDFIIYPEYENAREIERIREFVKEFETKLGKALSESPPDWMMSSKVREVLIKSSILAATMPKEYGGVDVGQKDLLQIAECMGGLDLSTFTSFSQIFMISNLLVQFGNQEQCKRYLPGIAAGKWRPTICWQEDTTGVTPTTQVFQARGQGKRLCAVKVNVLDATDANLFIVFANKKSGDVVTPTCYIIEKDAIANDAVASIQVKDQIKSSGLENCNFSSVVFDNIPLVETYQLGDHVSSDTLMEELNFAGKTLYGAATVGFLKKVLAELCTFANTEVKGNLRLSDSHPVQKELYELGILTYIVESISYYIAGLSDEGLFLVQDIENSIIQRFANRALRQAIRTITEVAGINSTDVELPYNKMIKDSIALMSISDPDLHLVRRITIPAIEHHVNYFGGLQNFMRTSTLQKLYHWNHLETYLHPKLVHFIAEHVHRSLLESAQQFEYSMIRLNKIIEILVMQRGIYINTDYVALQDISTLIENNLAMIASLARASRSYSIGVRNSDLEVQWTNFFCQRAGQHSKRIIAEILAQKENLIGTNPKLTNGALTLLDANGYCLESPIEKNW